MTRHQDENGPPSPIGWGCLVIAILIAGAAALAAIVFLWDVNSPH